MITDFGTLFTLNYFSSKKNETVHMNMFPPNIAAVQPIKLFKLRCEFQFFATSEADIMQQVNAHQSQM